MLALSTPVLLITLPLLPVRSAGSVIGVNYDAGETIAWPRYVAQIAAVYRQQPAGTQVLTGNYGEAGAVDRYGPQLGLPLAYSGHNGFADWGPPPSGSTIVVAVGIPIGTLNAAFTRVRPEGHLDTAWGSTTTSRARPCSCAQDHGTAGPTCGRSSSTSAELRA